MSEVRVGFVGVGMMSQVAHIPSFQQAKGARVMAACSSRSKLLELVAERFQIPRRYADHRELAEDPDIDLAAVIVPPQYNVQPCLELLEAGKHVFCEKPVALRAADAQRLLDAARANGRHFLVGFMKRADAGVQAAKALTDRWFETGEAGKFLFARAHSFIGGDWLGGIGGLLPTLKTDEPMSPREPARGPAWLPAQYGTEPLGFGSAYYFVNHVHSHDMDLLNHFLGPGVKVEYADWSRPARVAVLDFDGKLATLELGAQSSNTRWDEEITLFFEGGRVKVSLPPPMLINVPAQVEVYWLGERQELCNPQVPYSWSFLRQAQNVVDVVRGEAAPLCTGEDGLAQLQFTEALFQWLSGLRQ